MIRKSASRVYIAFALLAIAALACGSSSSTPPAAATSAPVIPTAAPDLQPTVTHQATGVKPKLTRESLQGTFDISGTNLDGSAYTGTLNLALNDSYNSNSVKVDVYDATWGDGSTGTGMLLANMLATSFGSGKCGAVFYTINSDMSLDGLWLTVDTKKIGTETITPTDARSSLGGTYQVNGTNPDGSAYTGTFELIQQGDVWQIIWDIAGNTFDGVGITTGDLFAAAYGGDGCGVGLYEATSDNSLSGIWAVWGLQQMGTETAIKRP
jgi:hypothetical protein